MKRILLILSTLLVVASCYKIHRIESLDRRIKADRMEVSHIKYGLFNVDEWKVIIAGIITKKIGEFEIDSQNRGELKQKIEGILEKLIAEIDIVLRKENNRRGIKGFFRGMAMDLFDVVEDVKKGIPRYADLLLDYLEDPENREEIRKYLIQRFNEFADKTAGEVDYSVFNEVLDRYGADNTADCILHMDAVRTQLRAERLNWIGVLVGAVIAFLFLLWFMKNTEQVDLYAFVVICLSLLVTGISLPMIDIEATISQFEFTLVGEPVSFVDQVLFFQSKSIVEVVYLLMGRGELPLFGVAVLIFAFSVLIPALKLVLSAVTIARGRMPSTALGKFLVFKSSKWSMADVMVVAIFMSYIGFNGVVNSELTQLKSLSGNVQVFTTNNSTLMTGFYLFTGYCLLGLLLASVIEARLFKLPEQVDSRI